MPDPSSPVPRNAIREAMRRVYCGIDAAMHRRVSTPQISIVIPAYVSTPRQADLLDETLATVDRQDHDRYEVIVVDDGSPLPVAKIVACHRRATVISRKNGGAGGGRENGNAANPGGAARVFPPGGTPLPGGRGAGWAP